MIMLIVLATLREELVRKAVKMFITKTDLFNSEMDLDYVWGFSINDVLINGLKKYSNIMLTFNKPLCVTVLHYFLIYFFSSWFLSLLSVWLH